MSSQANDSSGSEDVGSYRNVEISSAFTHLPQKDMARDSPVGSPVVSRRTDLNNVNNTYHIDPGLHEQAFQQQILQLKKQQQLQQQILLQHFQAQQAQLAEQHEQQLQQHLKKAEKAAMRFHRQQAMEFWEQQKQLEEQRERREKEKLEALKKKDKNEHSAVASNEVKRKLMDFLQKKQEAAAAAAANGTLPVGSPSGYRNWSVLQAPQGSDASSSVTSINPATGVAHSYRMQSMMPKFDDDFPLRKTASEPNLLKVRLKQRVMNNHRNSPLARHKDRHLSTLKRKSQLAIDTSSSNPDSGPSSPPSVANAQPSPTAGRNTPIQEEGEVSPYGPLASSSHQGSMSDLSLYSSPSMPNISLGRPPIHSSLSEGAKLAPVSEAEVRAACTARLGMPLTGQMLPGTLPYYPTLPVIDGDYSNPNSPGYIHKQMQSLEQARPGNLLPSVYQGAPITDTQVAHARLNKQGHRPLGRTQSAPLPLGHPMLAGSSIAIVPTHYEEYLPEKQLYDQQQAHNFLKQQIRQTVLTRVGGRGQSSGGQLDEAPETEESAEVIDLTDRKGSEESEISKQQRDREQFLQQQRDLMMRNTLQVSEGSAFSPRSSHIARPLSRALSSPLVALGPTDIPASSCVAVSNHCSSAVGGSGPHRLTTGLAFDSLMLKHACICGDNSSHPEHGGRLQSVWARLMETGLVQRCDRVRSRKATLEEIQACHSEAHALLFGTNPLNRQKLDMSKLSQLPIKSFVRLPCGGIGVDSDTTWNELHTAPAARMAVGCVVDLAFKAAAGDIKNGFAVVRPPGHHAEASQAMGFCFFNSVAIAARLLQQRLDMQRILIVDWDVHHGNGTQQMFYDDPRVLYLSIHRHDDGNFFPGTGGPTECGAGEGVGFNVNLAWSGGLAPPMGDAEYLAAFRTVVLPIAKEFAPEIVLVSAGFDAAAGHAAPLGGYKVSPACFGHMTQQLLKLADGKVILSLEGGYDLPSICDSAQECVRALLGDDPSPLREEELMRLPCHNAIDTLQKTIAIQLPHWPCIKRTAHTAVCSAVEAVQKEKDESETVTAMASLSMQQQSNSLQTPEHSRGSSEEPMEQDDAK
ncbi:histone deacetylase 4 isoform X5 [Cryptotermes secundus]|uniref:histone deacetylase 4 isoform X5 n=1 Tax=Cryptotermes secundus TaxID=105785 RepID=UPI001454D351|nr:histone deacetylase 4 isoform X5 [Cryptotermes secundus]